MESGCSQTKYSHISKLLSIWFASLCLLLIVANVRSAAHWISDSLSLQGILFAAAVVCAFALLVWFLLKLNTKSDEIADENHPKSRFSVLFAAALFLLSFFLKAIFVFIIKTPQYSDFQLFYWVTVEIAEGIPNYLSQRYFEIWAYQTGFPAAMALFVKILGRNINALVLVNCAFASLTNVFVYMIARLKCNERQARIASIAYMMFPFVFGLSSVYTNQHLATFLSYLGIYIFLKYPKSRILAPLICGLLIALGNGIRPEGVLFVAAFLVLLLYRLLADKGYRSERRVNFLSTTALPIGFAIASYMICFFLLSNLFVVTGLNPKGLSNDFPLYKFVVGLNHDTKGAYSQTDSKNLFESDIVTRREERDAEALRLIKERIKVPPKRLIGLLDSKINIMWTANGIYPAFSQSMDDTAFKIGPYAVSVKRIHSLFTLIDYLIYLFIYIVLFITSIIGVVKERETVQPFFVILFSIVFAVFLAIEVQYRYGYLLMPSLFIMLAGGLTTLGRNVAV